MFTNTVPVGEHSIEIQLEMISLRQPRRDCKVTFRGNISRTL